MVVKRPILSGNIFVVIVPWLFCCVIVLHEKQGEKKKLNFASSFSFALKNQKIKKSKKKKLKIFGKFRFFSFFLINLKKNPSKVYLQHRTLPIFILFTSPPSRGCPPPTRHTTIKPNSCHPLFYLTFTWCRKHVLFH